MKGYEKLPLPKTFTLERAWGADALADDLYERYHPYRSGAGRCAIHYFAREEYRIIAAFSFKPPAHGAAIKIEPDDPHSVIALSRMAAVPKEERRTKHISKIMRDLWERLPSDYRTVVTYSDSSCGHTGYVYQCCGFTKTDVTPSKYYVDEYGRRTSINTSGKRNQDAVFAGTCLLTRWELKIR